MNSHAPLPARARSAADLVPALQRGLALLELLAVTPDGATLTSLATQLSISSATAFRITSALEALGYIQRQETTKRFRLTKKFLSIGQPHSNSRTLIEAAIAPMRSILELTGETTQLVTLVESDCVLLEQLPSTYPFKYIVDLGSRVPAHCCAPGKAILAFLPPTTFHRTLESLTFRKFTPRTLTKKSAFLKQLDHVRATGFATDLCEHFEGIHCISAPLLDSHGHAIAAITIAGPSTRIPENKILEWGPIIARFCHQASRDFLD